MSHGPPIDDHVTKLFRNLAKPTQTPVLTYGHALKVDESQLLDLVALEHIFPKSLIRGLSYLESGKLRIFKYHKCQYYLIGRELPSLKTWKCTCQSMGFKESPPKTRTESKWETMCPHLMAVYIYELHLPILNMNSVKETEVSIDDYIRHLRIH